MPSEDPETLNEKKIPLNTHLPSSWDEAFAAFKNDLYSRGRSESTVAGYAYALQAFALFYRDRLKKPGPFVALLQETDVQAFVNHLRYDRHLSATSVNRHIAALRAFSSFLLVKGWHRRMIARDLKTYRIGSSNHLSSLSTEETRRLVTAVNLGGRNGRRDLAVVQIFLHCGLRVSELVGLSCDDAIIHKTIGKIRVRSEKRRRERTIPLNTTARKAIEDYLEVRGPTAGSDPLFVSERGLRISIASVQYLIKKYLCAAGREDLSTHDLRHHFAQRFYRQSRNLAATQQVLGHSDVNTTARYAGAADQEIQETIDALDDRPE
jgi:site-specific recombinase XerD